MLRAAETATGFRALVAASEAPRDLDREEVRLLEPILGALRREVAHGTELRADDLDRAAERLGTSSPARGRRLVRALAEGALRACETGGGPPAHPLRRLAGGSGRQQRLLVDLAGAVGELLAVAPASRREAARPFVAVLGEALWAVLALGCHDLRGPALGALGGLARAWPPGETPLLDRPAEGSVAALAPESEAADRSPAGPHHPRVIRRALGRRYERHRLGIRALSGDDEAAEELIRALETGLRRGAFAGVYPEILAELWRAASGGARKRWASRVGALLRNALPEPAGPAPQRHVSRTDSHGWRSLCRFAAEVLHDPLLAADAEVAVERIFAWSRSLLAVDLDRCLAEHDLSRAAFAASAASAAGGDDERAARVAEGLLRAADEMRPPWQAVGRCEAFAEALPALVLGTPAGAWKERVLEVVLAAAAPRPDDDGDALGDFRHAAAWAGLRRLAQAIRGRFEDSAPERHLAARAEGRSLVDPPLEEMLWEALVGLDASALAALAEPAETADWRAASRGGPASAVPLLAACAWELRTLQGLPERFRRWPQLDAGEKLWLVRLFALLATGSAAHAFSARGRRRLSGERAAIFAEAAKQAGFSSGREDSPRSRAVLAVVRGLPPEAAMALGDDLQAVVEEHLPHDQLGAADSNLDSDVLALVGPGSSWELCEQVARLVERYQLQARAIAGSDFATPLYQLLLAGAGPEVFGHLAARLEEPEEHRLAMLVYDNAHRLQEAAAEKDVEQRRALIAEHLERLLADLAGSPSPVIEQVQGFLRQYLKVLRDPWRDDARDLGRPASPDLKELQEVFRRADGVSSSVAHPLALGAATATEMRRLKTRLQEYHRLPIGRFEERSRALYDLIVAVRALRRRLRRVDGLLPPLSLLFDTLLAHWQRRFHEIRDGKVLRALHLMKTGATRSFYEDFVAPAGRPVSTPEREAYEDLFVRWAVSLLDLAVLRDTVARRWQPSLRALYRLATSFPGVLAFLAAPYVLLAVLGAFPEGSPPYELRAAGFVAYTVAVFAGLVVVLSLAALRLFRPSARDPVAGELFQCFVPNLVSLIIIPMAVLVDIAPFAYSFPLRAPDTVVVLVVGLSFLATLFHVGREIRAHGRVSGGAGDRGQVLQVAGLALFEAFVTALVLAALFGNEYLRVSGSELLDHGFEARFLGVLPRLVEVRTGTLDFLVQPTAILVWTAFGLFSGIFLRNLVQADSESADSVVGR